MPQEIAVFFSVWKPIWENKHKLAHCPLGFQSSHAGDLEVVNKTECGCRRSFWESQYVLFHYGQANTPLAAAEPA